MQENGTGKHDDLARKYAHNFEILLEHFRRPNGDRWKGTEIAEATKGKVGTSYVSSLLRGRIKRPGAEHLQSLARVVGFPVSYWSMEPDDLLRRIIRERYRGGHRFAHRHEAEVPPRADGTDIASDGLFAGGALLKDLFENLLAWTTLERGTAPSNREVVENGAGRLGEIEIAKIRRGELGGLTMAQALALSEALAVPVSYWYRNAAARELLDLNTVEQIFRQPKVAVLWRDEGFTTAQARLLRSVAENLRREDADEAKPSPWE